MKTLNPFFGLICAAAILGSVATGCGESGGPDPKTEKARVDNAVQMRELFNKAGGDYSKLDAADKAEFDKMAGGEAAGSKAFAEMKAGPRDGAASGPPAGGG